VSQVTSGVRAILSRPAVYELWSELVGGERARRIVIDEYARPTDGDRVLDLGCGPGDLITSLPESVSYVGVDISPEYIASARARFGARGEFEVGDASGFAVGDRRFDLVIVVGVLHHLNDHEVAELFAGAAAVVADRGRIMTIDPVHAPGQSRVARAIIDRDRGQHVRDADGYALLARTAWESVQVAVRHDLLRMPYSHCILEGCAPRPQGER
jgi:SAM-dependent methyltransferase